MNSVIQDDRAKELLHTNLENAIDHYRSGRYEESALLYLIELEKSQLRGDHLLSAEICSVLAEVYIQQRKSNAADNMYSKAITHYKKCSKGEHWKITPLEAKQIYHEKRIHLPA